MVFFMPRKFRKRVQCHLGGGFKHFFFHPYLGKWSNLTNIFQLAWNHQLAIQLRRSLSTTMDAMGCFRTRKRFPRFPWAELLIFLVACARWEMVQTKFCGSEIGKHIFFRSVWELRAEVVHSNGVKLFPIHSNSCLCLPNHLVPWFWAIKECEVRRDPTPIDSSVDWWASSIF